MADASNEFNSINNTLDDIIEKLLLETKTSSSSLKFYFELCKIYASDSIKEQVINKVEALKTSKLEKDQVLKILVDMFKNAGCQLPPEVYAYTFYDVVAKDSILEYYKLPFKLGSFFQRHTDFEKEQLSENSTLCRIKSQTKDIAFYFDESDPTYIGLELNHGNKDVIKLVPSIFNVFDADMELLGLHNEEFSGWREINFETRLCPTCHGENSDHFKTCEWCGGSGESLDWSGDHFHPVTKPCPQCNGAGALPCDECNGTGITKIEISKDHYSGDLASWSQIPEEGITIEKSQIVPFCKDLVFIPAYKPRCGLVLYGKAGAFNKIEIPLSGNVTGEAFVDKLSQAIIAYTHNGDYYTFFNNSVETLEFRNPVKRLKAQAFRSYDGWQLDYHDKNIKIGDGIIIEDNAFNGVEIRYDRKIYISKGVTEIGARAFEKSEENLNPVDAEVVFLDRDFYAMTRMKNFPWTCNAVPGVPKTKVTYKEPIYWSPRPDLNWKTYLMYAVDNVLKEGSIPGLQKIREISIGDNVTELSDNVLSGASAQKITFSDSIQKIGNNAFKDATIKEYRSNGQLFLPEELKHIGNSAFENTFSMAYIHEIFFDYKLENIGNYAFANNERVSDYKYTGDNIQNPEYFKQFLLYRYSIDYNSIEFTPDYYDTHRLGYRAFYNSRAQSIEVPMGICLISSNAFENCSNLTNITFTGKIGYISPTAFASIGNENPIQVKFYQNTISEIKNMAGFPFGLENGDIYARRDDAPSDNYNTYRIRKD